MWECLWKRENLNVIFASFLCPQVRSLSTYIYIYIFVFLILRDSRIYFTKSTRSFSHRKFIVCMYLFIIYGIFQSTLLFFIVSKNFLKSSTAIISENRSTNPRQNMAIWFLTEIHHNIHILLQSIKDIILIGIL